MYCMCLKVIHKQRIQQNVKKRKITMKTIIIFSILMISVANCTYSQSEDTLYLSAIDKIAKNTEPPTIAQQHIDYLAFGIAAFALIAAIVSVIYAVRTYRNTRPLRSIAITTQKEKILKELIRHLYRDKVVVSAIIRDLKENINKYPSEEHLLKINFSESALYMSKFSDFFDNFDDLHHLEVRFRNFNIEVSVTL